MQKKIFFYNGCLLYIDIWYIEINIELPVIFEFLGPYLILLHYFHNLVCQYFLKKRRQSVSSVSLGESCLVGQRTAKVRCCWWLEPDTLLSGPTLFPPALWLYGDYLVSTSFAFLICKMGTAMVPTSKVEESGGGWGKGVGDEGHFLRTWPLFSTLAGSLLCQELLGFGASSH